MDDRVLWYPGYTDKFVTFGHGQDVKLYKVARVSEVKYNLWLSCNGSRRLHTVYHIRIAVCHWKIEHNTSFKWSKPRFWMLFC